MTDYDNSLQFEQTNYLDLARFHRFIEAIPKLLAFHSSFQKPPMDYYHFQMLYKIAYHCALRISEALNLEAEDFDLEHRVLRLQKRQGASKTFDKMKVKVQKTSIGPLLLADLAKFLADKKGKLFNCHRATAWKYAKQAGNLANLKVYEEQKQRSINGVWTHLFRKSYAKLMEEMKASPSLIMLKGRWSPREMYQTYTKPSLNYLIEWEAKAFGN